MKYFFFSYMNFNGAKIIIGNGTTCSDDGLFDDNYGEYGITISFQELSKEQYELFKLQKKLMQKWEEK